MRLRVPPFLKRLYPAAIWNFPNEADSVFLTFDDGPTPEITPWVINKLAEYDAKATFFCLGKNVEQHPEEFTLIRANGHSVGNHSYSHQRGFSMPTGSYVEDVDLADEFIRSNLFRPPYSFITPTQVRVLSERYKIIMWNVLSLDYSNKITNHQCLKQVVGSAHPGAVIVFHDSLKSAKHLKYVLPKALDFFVEKGWKMKAIEY
ncbi:MAG: polysaccharide deacetylase family protein [Prevotellaceae bacterium]|jgi:peptidoglycan/xylan/chitin deacetylase (PgdA/CDA1 family)|nr:polysaccharide deacetylase family protein [Prevotellaceae bacterium]